LALIARIGEEKGQVYISLGVNPPGLLQEHDDILSPDVARNEKEDHK